ncbi:MAG: hypothetical protein KKD18_05910 [Nanoarchaeota archaeon]|nr:hypothetical protein [Nanoarchaeota archaeon]MBU0977926.1 hypothetical protein [Nanoarchaeota archaeon]
MITTIQLSEEVKRELDRFKVAKKTYEDVIVELIKKVDTDKKEQEALLIEGCKAMYHDMIEINKEWEAVDAEIDWEWNDNGNGNKKRRHPSR